MREEIKGEGTGEAISHYTDAVRFGNLLFISGVMPIDGSGKVIGGADAAAQTRGWPGGCMRLLPANYSAALPRMKVEIDAMMGLKRSTDLPRDQGHQIDASCCHSTS